MAVSTTPNSSISTSTLQFIVTTALSVVLGALGLVELFSPLWSLVVVGLTLAATYWFLWRSEILRKHSASRKSAVIVLIAILSCLVLWPAVSKLYNTRQKVNVAANPFTGPPPGGTATTHGDNSPANTGNNNTFSYGSFAGSAPPKRMKGTNRVSEITVPADAQETGDGSFRYTDPKGKKWIYRRTPFGITKSEEGRLEAHP